MALEVFSDSRAERHRNWVASTLVQALGARIVHGLWVLRLQALESGGVSIALTGPNGAHFKAQVAKPRGQQVPELDTTLKRALGRLS